jgi:type II secretory pathway pseudopilin PulG
MVTVQLQRGFALMFALMAVALVSLAVLLPLERATLDARRERENDLLFVGDQYRQAIERYHSESPVAPEYPATLEALVDDVRWPVARRPLRRLYPDPMTGKVDWGVVRQGDRIVGIYSRAAGAPLKRSGFPVIYERFSDAESYEKWVFSAGAGAAVATQTHAD